MLCTSHSSENYSEFGLKKSLRTCLLACGAIRGKLSICVSRLFFCDAELCVVLTDGKEW